jgi:hypothetical protein
LELAQLHSTAVDFAKTGVPAVLPLEKAQHASSFDEGAAGAGLPTTDAALEAARLASALYVVTYDPEMRRWHDAQSPRNRPPPPLLLSFPWLAADALASVKRAARQ